MDDPPLTDTLSGPGYDLYVTVDGTLTAQAGSDGILYPQYQVESIVYATPGNASNNGYTNATTDGTTTSIGSSFQNSSSVTFSSGFDFFLGGETMSWTYGYSQTNGNSTATTSTISDASGVVNASGGSSNGINHHQDLFIIWLNPAVHVVQSPSGTSYGFGTQGQTAGDPSPGSPEIKDEVEVTAQGMIGDSSGHTNVPLQILLPQIVDGQTLPGLASICAHPTYYPSNCTQANQCGCTAADFAPMLAFDPLLNYAGTQSPLNADTSGPAVCANPSASSKCRYVPVIESPGSTIQVSELLAGPECSGCNRPVNSFTQTDSNQTAQTFSESYSQTVGSSFGVKFGPEGTLSLTNNNQFTWTDSESTGKINGTANSMSVSLSSSTQGCYEDIAIFEDTVFHTFVFQQPSGNNSCP